MLMDTPLKYMATRAVSTLRGMLMATTSVGRTSLRKRARIRIASPAPISILVTTTERIISIYAPWSTITVISRPGYFSSSLFSSSIQIFATSLAPASLLLKMLKMTPSLVPSFVKVTSELSIIVISATSLRSTVPTPSMTTSGVFSISSIESNSFPILRSQELSSLSSRYPAGISKFCAYMSCERV